MKYFLDYIRLELPHPGGWCRTILAANVTGVLAEYNQGNTSWTDHSTGVTYLPRNDANTTIDQGKVLIKCSAGNIVPTSSPTVAPSQAPTSAQPTSAPSMSPTSSEPSASPSSSPSVQPTVAPSQAPTSAQPTSTPSMSP